MLCHQGVLEPGIPCAPPGAVSGTVYTSFVPLCTCHCNRVLSSTFLTCPALHRAAFPLPLRDCSQPVEVLSRMQLVFSTSVFSPLYCPHLRVNDPETRRHWYIDVRFQGTSKKIMKTISLQLMAPYTLGPYGPMPTLL